MQKVIIKTGLSLEIAKELKRLKIASGKTSDATKFAIITDSKVKHLYGGKLLWNLKKSGLKAEILSFPQGEKSKTLSTVEALSSQMIEMGFDRSSIIIALGGGVVGDIAGFLASIYMRRIPYVQIPTTLLAMIDSGIGGKTGVNLKEGKNLIGTFYQPLTTLIDPFYLKSLPVKHIKNGLAEAVKYGVIKDKKLFNFIDKNLGKLLGTKTKTLDQKTLNHLIKTCVEIKLEIVAEDEKENGIRQILNYGHTFGHAIEKQSNYTLLHGFAISIGMVLANQKAVKLGLLSEKDAGCIKNVLKKAGLPVYTMHKPTLKDLAKDKKKHGNSINFILPTKIGNVKTYNENI